MPNRMDIAEAMTAWKRNVCGYALREGQEAPSTYKELIDFMVDRLGMDDSDTSVEPLSSWLIEEKTKSTSCSPETDTRHVEAVILIGELADPDAYVASLPIFANGIAIPPPEILRAMI